PNARLRLMSAKELHTALDLLGSVAAPAASGIAVYARSALKARTGLVLLRTMPQAAAAAAHELFSVLRELDAHGVQLIWVETPPDGPEWEGVRDRLQRAAAS
ncbi:MAG: Sua5 family C-terminal domain-containing protein, partial [Rhodoferax sp.]